MDRTLRIAHRGAKGYAPENTIESFQKAIDLGCDGIELDVHLSLDNEVIVIHDETVDRTTGGKGLVGSMAVQEIKALTIKNGESVPTLIETLDVIDGRCLVNIEIKKINSAVRVLEIVQNCVAGGRWRYQDFLISSFDWIALKAVHDNDPEIPIGVLTDTDVELAINFSKFIKAHSIHPYFHLLTKENILKMQVENLKVYTWTVNEHEDIARVKSFGVDAIISDFPDRI